MHLLGSLMASGALFQLTHTDSRHRHLLEKVGRPLCTVRVIFQLRLEFGVTKSTLKVLDRLPDRVVYEYTTSSDASVKLGRNEPGLLFHECCIRCPSLEQLVDLSGISCKFIDYYSER